MKKKLTIFLISLTVLTVPFFVFAVDSGDIGLGFLEQIGLANADPRDVIANLIKVVIGFLGIISVIIILYGGFLWMLSLGDTEKVDKAKQTLTGGIIGLIIILSAYGLANFILESILAATNVS